MIDWWSETEHAVVECLASAGPMSPQDLARRLGLSEGETVAFLCMLVREQKVAMQVVGLTAVPSGRPAREAGRHRAKAPTRREPAYAGGH
jgi:predicted ArsR family transcriptional regulator